jgi:hypothetical protein
MAKLGKLAVSSDKNKLYKKNQPNFDRKFSNFFDILIRPATVPFNIYLSTVELKTHVLLKVVTTTFSPLQSILVTASL